MLYNNILETIGHTPLVKLNKIMDRFDLSCNLYAKIESFNPAGSIKDRPAYNMLKTALEEKVINQHTHIIEATSGNTGIGLALVCSVLNLKLTIVMPENMSLERQKIIKAYGAKLVLTDGSLGMHQAVKTAEEFLQADPHAFCISQFDNPNNPLAHRFTASEIYQDLPNVDCFVAGIGTGGTITGVGKHLKALQPQVKIIGVEPATSPLITQGYAGPHKIQGIGPNFIPNNLDLNYVDQVVTVDNEILSAYAKILAAEEGILCGFSGAATFHAALQLAKSNDYHDIVFILADSGERYLSTTLFE